MRRKLVLLLALSLAACAVAPAFAAEGRTPVFLPGTTLVADGKYILTRNLIAPGGAVITICGTNVDLDLNGMVVTNFGPGPTIFVGAGAPGCPAAGVDHVTIRNGVIVGGDAGIEIQGFTRKVDIEDVKIKDTGGFGGIFMVDVEGAAIRRVEITDSAGDGISWLGGVIKHGTIEHNLIRRAGAGGSIFVDQCSSLGVLNNRIEEGPGSGIFLISCGASLVAENTIERKGGEGISIRNGRGNKLLDNLVLESILSGIVLDDTTINTLVLNNNSSGNGSDGIMVLGNRNLIERNVLNDNGRSGLIFLQPIGPGPACENTYGRNTARGNFGFGLPVCGPAPPGQFPPDFCDNTPAGCFGPGNTSYGDNLMPGPPIG